MRFRRQSGTEARLPGKTAKGGEQARIAVLCIASAGLLFGVFGCQQAQEQPAEQAETQMEETMPMEEEMAMVDPVWGMGVTEDWQWTAEYEGKTYYFCSESCRDEFMASPMEYMHDTEHMEHMGGEGSDMYRGPDLICERVARRAARLR